MVSCLLNAGALSKPALQRACKIRHKAPYLSLSSQRTPICLYWAHTGLIPNTQRSEPGPYAVLAHAASAFLSAGVNLTLSHTSGDD